MDFARLFLLARRIHRLSVLLVVAFGLTMLVTGIMMKYGFDTTGAARQLHNLLSPFFGGIFFIMLLTGLVMYLQPWLVTWKRKQKDSL